MPLSTIPPAPIGVKYALTVPQSVLFADLSLRGSLRNSFQQAMHIDYEPRYIVIDDGAMSWNYDSDSTFTNALMDGRSIVDSIQHFISAMGATSRALRSTAAALAPEDLRRPGNIEDLREDLIEYWRACTMHLSSLFVFWNVRELLTKAVAAEFGTASKYQGVSELVQPSETNYFALERRCFDRIIHRFRNNKPAADKASLAGGSDLITAVDTHIRQFGFVFAPFNLGSLPTAQSLLARGRQAPSDIATEAHLMDFHVDTVPGASPLGRRLGVLIQEMTFWKSERVDVLSLTDQYIGAIYTKSAAALRLTTDELFSMTSTEIADSLAAGHAVVDEATIHSRMMSYCLALCEGQIDFYRPSSLDDITLTTSGIASVGTTIRGMAASSGVLIGRVKVVNNRDDLDDLALGDVLVTAMIRPEMGTALDRASAFVTDQGGLMSHAAIMAREMNKPCVIATENATQVLRDGIRVEVNGGNGTVTIVP